MACHVGPDVPREARLGIDDLRMTRWLNIHRNGKTLRMVVAYNLDEDWVEAYAQGEDGKLIKDDGKGRIERLHGGVTVEWRSGTPDDVKQRTWYRAKVQM